ncbi:MAG: hypothetical protein ACYDCI_00125 [Candidatus Limnocylindrales bacterium]
MNRDEIVETLREWGNENKKLADDVWRRLGFPCRVQPTDSGPIVAEELTILDPPAFAEIAAPAVVVACHPLGGTVRWSLAVEAAYLSALAADAFSPAEAAAYLKAAAPDAFGADERFRNVAGWCYDETKTAFGGAGGGAFALIQRARTRPRRCVGVSDWRNATTEAAEIGELIPINFGLGSAEVEIVADDDPRRILPLPDGLFRTRTRPCVCVGISEWRSSTTLAADIGDVLIARAGLDPIEVEIVADDDPRLRVVTHVETPSPTDAESEKDAMERFFFGG